MDSFPVFCQLKGCECLLVGGGKIAERKARLLLDAGALVTANAKSFTMEFLSWSEKKQITLIKSEFNPKLLNKKWLVIAATDDPLLNKHISLQARMAQIFCNVVDTPDLSSFIIPSIIDRSPVMVAVSTSGLAPVLARLLREKLETFLPSHLGQLAKYAGSLRKKVKQCYKTVTERRRFWEKLFLHDRLAQSLANKDRRQIERLTHTLFNDPPDYHGEVVLVGAGPGDAGLLTLKGLQQIQQADVIIYDHLVSNDIMKLIRRDAERFFVGKRAGHHCVTQEQINLIILEQAKKGKRVVRLKGGDPFIFGRGGEELEILQKENIPFSVVPGVTAASGCAAYSGIPLTHRDYAHSVRLITGHLKDGNLLDWQSLVTENQTLVFYMGLSRAENIQTQLTAHGMATTIPVAIIEAGTTTKQKVIYGILADLHALAQQSRSPALIIIGSVVALRNKLNWFSSEKSPHGAEFQ